MGSHDLKSVPGAATPQGPALDVYSATDQLAQRHQAVNLGRGAPDFDGPAVLRRAALHAMRTGLNQYVASAGHPDLLHALAQVAVPPGTAYDPDSEITVTAGATEALAVALDVLLEPGDEVVTLEPFYDSYPSFVQRAGGVPVPVPLVRSGDRYVLDVDAVAAAIGPRTRVLLLNTPHNPTGWVASEAELAALADLVLRHDLRVVTDEVYEELTYGGSAATSFEGGGGRRAGPDLTRSTHRSIAALPGMRERTVVCSSSAKSLSVCGWRVGWAFAPPAISAPLRHAHRMVSYCAPVPFQVAVATALRWARSTGWFAELRTVYRERRDTLLGGLTKAGLRPNAPDGGFMVIAETGSVLPNEPLAANELLARELGVTGLPLPGFYARPDAARGLLRFAFCKEVDVLQEAARRLAALDPTVHRGTVPG